MLLDHGSVMLHFAACSFWLWWFDLFLFAVSFCFLIALDFLIFTGLVAQSVAFHLLTFFSFLFSFVCCPHLCLVSISVACLVSQSFPPSNTKCPTPPSTLTPLPSTDSTALAHFHHPTSVWPPPTRPLPPPLPPPRRRRPGTRPSSSPSFSPSCPPH